MSFCLSQVPDKRWVTIEFDLLLDREETKTWSFDIELAVKNPDELQQIHKEVIDSVKEDAAKGKEIYPSDDVQMRFVRRLLLDWDGIEVQAGKEQAKGLPYNERNFKRVIHIPEARAAIYSAVIKHSNRKDLVEKN